MCQKKRDQCFHGCCLRLCPAPLNPPWNEGVQSICVSRQYLSMKTIYAMRTNAV